jgi:hypothetical protein
MNNNTADVCQDGGGMTERVFYVSVVDGRRTGLLRGPFATHAEALALVEPVRTWVVARDPRAHFYGFGTAAVRGNPETAQPGRLNDVMAGVAA